MRVRAVVVRQEVRRSPDESIGGGGASSDGHSQLRVSETCGYRQQAACRAAGTEAAAVHACPPVVLRLIGDAVPVSKAAWQRAQVARLLRRRALWHVVRGGGPPRPQAVAGILAFVDRAADLLSRQLTAT